MYLFTDGQSSSISTHFVGYATFLVLGTDPDAINHFTSLPFPTYLIVLLLSFGVFRLEAMRERFDELVEKIFVGYLAAHWFWKITMHVIHTALSELSCKCLAVTLGKFLPTSAILDGSGGRRTSTSGGIRSWCSHFKTHRFQWCFSQNKDFGDPTTQIFHFLSDFFWIYIFQRDLGDFFSENLFIRSNWNMHRCEERSQPFASSKKLTLLFFGKLLLSFIETFFTFILYLFSLLNFLLFY